MVVSDKSPSSLGASNNPKAAAVAAAAVVIAVRTVGVVAALGAAAVAAAATGRDMNPLTCTTEEAPELNGVVVSRTAP